MLTLPFFVYLLFFVSVLFTLFAWIEFTARSVVPIMIVICWLGLQTVLSVNGFYTDTTAEIPRFPALLLPPVVCILILLLTPRGRRWIDSCVVDKLYLMHIVRVPIEILLYILSLYRLVPELMTFSDGNYDIISGITAPIIYYFGVIKRKLSNTVMLFWNLACLALLGNIVYDAIFSAPLPFQKYAFDQPNVAVLYFPFTWLPAFIVPLVLFAHIVAIRSILLRIEKKKALAY